MSVRYLGIAHFDESYITTLAPSSKVLFSDLSKADLSNKNLQDCEFFGCILDACDFLGADLTGCVFHFCYVTSEDEIPFFNQDYISLVDFSGCNFVIGENPIIVEDDSLTTINRVLSWKRKEFGMEMLDDIRSTVLEGDSINTLKETVAYVHLYYYPELIKRNAYHIYFKFFQRPDVRDILREKYDDLLEFFLSFSIDSLLGPDYMDLLEEVYFGKDYFLTIDESIVFNLIDRMHSEVPQEQLKGMKYASQFHGYAPNFLNRYDFDRIFSFLLSDLDALRKKARGFTVWMLRELGFNPDEKIKITLDEFRKKLEPYLLKTLASSMPKIKLAGLGIVEEGRYWEWDKKEHALKLLEDKNDEVKTLAREVAAFYEWI